MYRQQLIGVLKQASQAVSGLEVLSSDLATAAHALEVMSAEKYASTINPDAIKKMFEGHPGNIEGKTPTPFTPTFDGVTSEKAQWDKPFTWNKQASEAVRRKLATTFGKVDTSLPEAVPSAALTPEQTPNGEHPGMGTVKDTQENTGATLTPEQTPDNAAALNTDMLAKSEKQASDPAPTVAPEEGKKDEAAAVKTASEKAVLGGYSFAGVHMAAVDALEGVCASESEAGELSGLFQE